MQFNFVVRYLNKEDSCSTRDCDIFVSIVIVYPFDDLDNSFM